MLSHSNNPAQKDYRDRLSHPVEKLATGAVRFDTTLQTIWMWVEASGVVVLAVGGIGAIHWAIRLRREAKGDKSNY